MAKMNMAAVAQKVGGMAGGIALAGAIQKYLEDNGSDAMKKMWGPLGMIVAGAYLPSVAGKGNAIVAHAADGIMMKGVNAFMTGKFKFIAGLDDEMVSGPYDDSVAGYPTSDEVIVSGPGYDYDNSDKVSGFTN